MANKLPIIAVVGPTASGKTEIGIQLARQINGEIISVDSMQIYRWMDIGTAKPSIEMREAVPHHLIDILNPDETYNAGKFANDAAEIISRLADNNKPSILLGGTNLYLKSLIHGIIPVPTISVNVKNDIKTLTRQHGVEGCYALLKEKDPVSADKLHPNDISRISRALEVVLETGESIQKFQNDHQFQEERYRTFYVGPWWSRETLYQRINQRTYQMVAEGLIEEAENLLWRGYSSDLPSMRSIGYKQALAHLNDEMDLNTMISDIQQKSRHYAKKQITWSKQNPKIHWLENGKLTTRVIEEIKQFLDN